MPWFQKLLAAAAVLACGVLLLRLAMGARRRAWLDATVLAHARRLRRAVRRMWHARALRRDAAREARAAIERARRAGHWQGNVVRPKSFRRPRKPH
jgi:hypothetical protein